ncbi:hypothetical protein ES703_124952 [subsurface metagenome]
MCIFPDVAVHHASDVDKIFVSRFSNLDQGGRLAIETALLLCILKSVYDISQIT